jgi:hypothetical protein
VTDQTYSHRGELSFLGVPAAHDSQVDPLTREFDALRAFLVRLRDASDVTAPLTAELEEIQERLRLLSERNRAVRADLERTRARLDAPAR